MDLRQLEILRAIAETGSFTAAGEKLHVSQSAISRQVLLLVQGRRLRYNDGWHRIAPQGLHHLADSPSRRARENAARVRSDISGGGHIRTSVDAFVLIERGTGDDCASSTVPVVCGVDALAARLRSRTPRVEVSARQVQAVADALTRPLAVAV